MQYGVHPLATKFRTRRLKKNREISGLEHRSRSYRSLAAMDVELVPVRRSFPCYSTHPCFSFRRRGVLMVRALYPESSDSGASPGRGTALSSWKRTTL